MAISIGDAVLKIGLDKKDFEHSMSGLVNGIKKHRKAIGLAMTATGAAIVGGLGLALKSAVGFESAMREVNTMIGLSQTEFEEFSKDVQDLSAELGVNAVDSAKALYQAISAGVPKENVLEFLRIATEAAIGGVTDTETAVDGLTTVINAFKLPMSDAQKVADIMFTTVKGGKTTFDELSASMFQVAPIAAASGVSFEEVSGALATMTKQGVPTTVAVTQLRQAMVALQKPTTLMSKTISDLGYETGQAMLEELGFAETIDMLRDSTHGSNEELLTMFGSVEAGAAILALTGDNAQTFADDLDAMTNSTGAATGAFEEMEESAGRQMDSLKAAFSDVAMTVGNVLIPVLTGIVDKIKPIIENIKNWISEHPALTRGIVLVVGAIGGLLLVFGPLLLILPGLIAAFKMFNIITLAAKVATALWTVAQWALNAALTANPIGLIIMAIAALIAIVITVVKKWDELVVFFKKLWSDIKIIFLKGVDKVLGILNAYVGWLPWVGDKVAEARDKISNLIDAERVKQQVERARQEIKEWADDVRDKSDQMKDDVEGFYTALIDKARESTSEAIDGINKILEEQRSAHDKTLALIDKERLARLAAVDADAAAELKRLQGAIEAIDEEADAQREAERVAAENEETRRLEAAIADEEDVDRRIQLEEDLADHLEDVARRHAEIAREATKDALRAEMEIVRENAERHKQLIGEQFDAVVQAEQDKLEVIEAGAAAEIAAMEQALVDKEAVYQADLDAFRAMATEKINDAVAFVKEYNEILGELGIVDFPEVGVPDLTALPPGVIEGTGIPHGIPTLQGGALITEPTLLSSMRTMKPVAIAGEAGPERLLGVAATRGGFGTANIILELDGEVLARVMGEPLVDEIRLRTGVHI